MELFSWMFFLNKIKWNENKNHEQQKKKAYALKMKTKKNDVENSKWNKKAAQERVFRCWWNDKKK